MVEGAIQRFRLTYSKEPSLRFIGHLDMLRTWERSLRRAKLGMAYTQGFHPHQRINLGAALPLGFSSECELIDIWLEESISPRSLGERISSTLPPGISVHSIEEIDLNSPALQQQIQRAEYQAILQTATSLEEVDDLVALLLGKDRVIRERRGKVYDLRPLIGDLEVRAAPQGVSIKMNLSMGQKGTGRPDEVLRELGFAPEKAHIVRTRLILMGAQS